MRSDAKVCKSCRSRQELSEHVRYCYGLLFKFSFFSLSPCPFSQSSFQIDPNSNAYLLATFGFDTASRTSPSNLDTWRICTRRAGKLYKARSRLYPSQNLQENYYALESSHRDLHNALLCTVLVGSVWVKKYTKRNIEKMKSCTILKAQNFA